MTAILAFFAGPLGKIAGYAMAAAAAIGGLLAILAGAKRAGVQQQQTADLRKTLDDVGTKNAVQATVDAQSDAAVNQQLRDKWTR